jgi:hypothetical protein
MSVENKPIDLFWEKMQIIDTRIMLNKLIRINLELFNEIRKYAHENGIPLSFSPSILSLIDEIEKTDVECFPPNENLQRKNTKRGVDRTLNGRMRIVPN